MPFGKDGARSRGEGGFQTLGGEGVGVLRFVYDGGHAEELVRDAGIVLVAHRNTGRFETVGFVRLQVREGCNLIGESREIDE